MNLRVVKVKPLKNDALEIVFSNGEIKIFDVKPYFHYGIFADLKDETQFNSVKAFNGTVLWANGLDFCPDTLYLESISKIL